MYKKDIKINLLKHSEAKELYSIEKLSFMKRNILCVLFLLILCSINIFGQYSLNENILNKAALLEFSNSSGSGFFYNNEKYLYLVTAKHVILDKNHKPKENILTIKYYGYDVTKSVADELIFYFDSLSIGSVRYTNNYDVIILRIAKFNPIDHSTVTFYNWVKKKNFPSNINSYNESSINTFDNVSLASDVFIIGYPKSLDLKSLNQFNYNRPLLRKGVIAGKNFTNKNLVLDCPTYYGNSGGPVIQVLSNKETRLIGFVSEFIPYTETWVNSRTRVLRTEIYNSGYTIIEPIDKVIDVINQMN